MPTTPNEFFDAVRNDRREKNSIAQTKNWWNTGRSDVSLEDKQQAQALAAAKEAEKLKRYDDLQKQKDANSLAEKTLDTKNTLAQAELASNATAQQSKNWNALQVAAIRANGSGAGKKDPSVLSANERMQAALKVQEQNSLPGKPMPLDAAVREVDKFSGGQTQVMRNADGTPVGTSAAETLAQRAPANSTVGMSAAETLAQRQALVPGHKNDPRGYAVDPSTIGISTPKGEAPTALTDKQWQQYADAKSPGMKFEGNQPGMVGDQIARFKRADGSTFFANTGAAKMQLGDALTPASATAPPLDNAPGSAPRATTPDAANRSAMNIAGAPKAKDPSIVTRLGQDFKGAIGAFSKALGSQAPEDITVRDTQPTGWKALIPSDFTNTNWADASMAAGMTRDTGEEPSIQQGLPPELKKSNKIGPSEAAVRAASAEKRAARRSGFQYSSTPITTNMQYSSAPVTTNTQHSSAPVATQEDTKPLSKKAQGFLNWYEQAASRNMPAYLQSRAAMQPVDAGQKISDLFKWWKDKSGRNMPKYAYPGSNM